ncbi:hypothetical protein GPJ56_000547 [Histomonas meleagridis]|uniref:uncharacterized protein n=1 Tax=Histomonas meleagridis TaxID=135588 RepID=UPI0035594735|nr:hypothetical protein GPJ56_000547 [Histomonas meleagridis]KAH0796413.1 hypothetical protein GO595_010306 [Histomonas meleagridis]
MNNNEILSYVDSLINEEESKSKKLQVQLDALSPSQKTGHNDVVFRQDVKFNIGVSRYERHISCNCCYEELFKQVAEKEGKTAVFGYEDKSRFKIWIRNDRDVMCCFREYFGSNLGSINFLILKNAELSGFTKLNLIEEIQKSDDTFQFKLAPYTRDYAMFTSLPKGITYEAALDYFNKFAPNHKRLSVIDLENDTIQITSDLEWGYFLNECEMLYPKGKYPILLVE